jgi:hypothetical protein
MSYASIIKVPVLATAAILALVSCKEEETKLFEEGGVWTLDRYSLNNTPYQEVNQGRKNKFLLRFKPEDGVIAAAGCHDDANEEIDVNSSSCTNTALSTWSCQCFSYTFENSRMVWQEFAPGDTPPPVGAVGGEGETGGDGGGSGTAHEVFVSAFGETAATYEFDSLPEGVFSSDGDIALHVFQLKADTIWTEVDINEDGMLDLELCSTQCFPSGL